MTGFGLLFRPLCNPTAYPLSSRPNTHCHPDRTPFVIPAAHPLSSRPQRRVLIQSAGDPSTSLRMTGFGQLPRPPSQSHTHFHPGRTPIVIPTAAEGSHPVGRRSFDSAQDDRFWAVTQATIPAVHPLSSRLNIHFHPNRTPIVIPTAVEGSHPVGTKLFDFAQDDSECPLGFQNRRYSRLSFRRRNAFSKLLRFKTDPFSQRFHISAH